MPTYLLHLLVLTAQALALAAFTMWLFRLREHYGLGLFFVGVASLHAVEVQTSSLPGVANNVLPMIGAALFFSSKLFAVLILYLREDASEARQLLYGLLLGSLGLVLAGSIGSLHVLLAGDFAWSKVWETLRIPVLTAYGLAILVLDGVILIISFEWLSRRLRGTVFLPSCVAMILALAVDNVLFNLAFVGQDNFTGAIIAGFIGKFYAAFIFSLFLSASLRLVAWQRERTPGSIVDVFDTLTYRQRFERLQQVSAHDSLTGLLTRERFDHDATALATQPSASIWVMDIDHFKSVNDRFGHAAGDQVLRAVAKLIHAQLPQGAKAYRYGGEEFVIVGPVLRADIEAMLLNVRKSKIALTGTEIRVTATFGGAGVSVGNRFVDAFPVADRRLYRGKQNGRDQIVDSD